MYIVLHVWRLVRMFNTSPPPSQHPNMFIIYRYMHQTWFLLYGRILLQLFIWSDVLRMCVIFPARPGLALRKYNKTLNEKKLISDTGFMKWYTYFNTYMYIIHRTCISTPSLIVVSGKYSDVYVIFHTIHPLYFFTEKLNHCQILVHVLAIISNQSI